MKRAAVSLILVAVMLLALGVIAQVQQPSRICCRTVSSCSVRMPSSRRFWMAASPCLKALMFREDRSYFSIQPYSFVPGSRIHFPIAIELWQSSGKVEKFDCDF